MYDSRVWTETYRVTRRDTGEEITDCAVLRPAEDPAARAALWAYADATGDTGLAQDIYRWIRDIQRGQ